MDEPTPQQGEQGKVRFERTRDATLRVLLSGSWRLSSDMPPATILNEQLQAVSPRRVAYDSTHLTHWDSALISFLAQSSEFCRARGIEQDRSALEGGLRHLVELAEAVPEKKGARADARRPRSSHAGEASIAYGASINEFLAFVGD